MASVRCVQLDFASAFSATNAATVSLPGYVSSSFSSAVSRGAKYSSVQQLSGSVKQAMSRYPQFCRTAMLWLIESSPLPASVQNFSMTAGCWFVSHEGHVTAT